MNPSKKSIVEQTAGSLNKYVLPSKFKGLSLDEIIKRAKEEHFRNKYKLLKK